MGVGVVVWLCGCVSKDFDETRPWQESQRISTDVEHHILVAFGFPGATQKLLRSLSETSEKPSRGLREDSAAQNQGTDQANLGKHKAQITLILLIFTPLLASRRVDLYTLF